MEYETANRNAPVKPLEIAAKSAAARRKRRVSKAPIGCVYGNYFLY